jgi:protocatechuate 3,4-dioxygenase alpha subunit
LLKRLATRIYFAGNTANQKDAILALVPAERQDTLMAIQDASRPGWWSFTIQLSGENETVFFDI